MKTEPIVVGDLVYVAKPSVCCGCDFFFGYVFIVEKISDVLCECSVRGSTAHGRLIYNSNYKPGGFPIERLRRIPPMKKLNALYAADRLRQGVTA